MARLRSSRRQGAQRRRCKEPNRVTRSGRQVATSYQELSIYSTSDDDDDEEDIHVAVDSNPSPPRITRSSNRAAATRKRDRSTTYHSDSENNEILHKKRKITSASFDDFSNDEASSNNDGDHFIPKAKRRATKSLSRSIVARPTQASPEPYINPKKIPKWASLPYHVLCQIFEYVSMPLCDDHFQKTPSTQWLLETAQLCRAFKEPCLKALYRCPPLAPMKLAHGLVQHLKADQNSMSMSYSNKIESIKLEVSSTAAYSLPRQGVLDIHGLVRNSTMLKDVEIYHLQDLAPYQNLKDSIKWSYPDALFDALAEEWTEEVEEFDRSTNMMVTQFRKHGPIKLRSWRWSSRLAGGKHTLDNLKEIHLTPSFIDLRKVAFVNYQAPKVTRDKQDNNASYDAKMDAALEKASKTLAEAIQVLPNLQHLVFESCELVNETLLPLLPSTLRVLEIVNCTELEADDMTKFLVSKGGNLRELILNHNHSLSLSFLPVLGPACPHLEVLRMNLHYYAQGLVDSNPEYDILLSADEVPTWPSSLRIIELNQLRNWDIETAEMFFQSITDSAEQLPNLRQLTIKASLSTNLWKLRAEVRTKWEETLKKVFLSNRPLPNPAWTSIAAFSRSQEVIEISDDHEPSNVTNNVQVIVDDDEDEDNDPVIGPTRRRNMRFREALAPQEVQEVGSSRRSTRKYALRVDPVPSLERGKRSTRSRITYAEPETSEDELAQPKTPDNRYLDFVSPPSSAGRADDSDQPSRRSVLHMNRLTRELAGLRATAGNKSNFLSSPPFTDLDSDDEPLLGRRALNSQGSVELFIQGMCDKVDISIGNLRPRGEEMKEQDFLDSEPDGDSDWDGDDNYPSDEVLAWD